MKHVKNYPSAHLPCRQAPGKGGSQISLEIRLCPQTAISGEKKRGALLQIHPSERC